MRTAQILCPRPERFTTDTPHRRDLSAAARFRHWVGYRLHPAALRVIAALERQRARGLPQRLIVCNTGDTLDVTRRVLVDYMRFLAVVVRPGAPFFLCPLTRKDGKALLPPKTRRRETPPYRCYSGTARSPEYCRGLDFPMALILDGDRHPRRGRYLSRLWRTVVPCIPAGRSESLLVVHGTYRPRTRVNFFSELVRRSRTGAVTLALLDLTADDADADEKPPAAAVLTEVHLGILGERHPSVLYASRPKRHLPPIL